LFEFNEHKERLELKEVKNFTPILFPYKNIKFVLDFLKNQEIPSENMLKLEKNFSKIIFEIETTGVLDAEEIFRISVMILKRKLNILGVNVEKISKN